MIKSCHKFQNPSRNTPKDIFPQTLENPPTFPFNVLKLFQKLEKEEQVKE